jgi:hypothetical protein
MPRQILPAASLRSAQRLPAARTLFRASNDLICLALWAIGRAIFRVAANFLLALREGCRPSLSPLERGEGLEGYSAGAKAGSFLPKLGGTVRRMSDGELSRIEVLRDVDRKELRSASVVPLLRLEPGIPPVEGLPSRGAGRREGTAGP